MYGQVQGCSDLRVVERAHIDVEHGDLEAAVRLAVEYKFALHVLYHLFAFVNAQMVGGTGGEQHLLSLESRDDRAFVLDDEGLEAVKIGPSLFEIVRVLDVSGGNVFLVLFHRVGAGPDHVLPLLKVFDLSNVLGHDFENVGAQVSEKVGGGELQRNLHCERVDDLNRPMFIISADFTGAGSGLIGFHPPVNAEGDVFGGDGFAVMPLYTLAYFENVGQAAVGDLPAFRQVIDQIVPVIRLGGRTR